MKLLDEARIDALLDGMADGLAGLFEGSRAGPPVVIGIHTGGLWLARRLHPRLQSRMPVAESIGSLDISFYRDDFSRVGVHPQVKPSDLPLDIESRAVILVDDVLFTGRTVRAALNEIFDYGRPACVRLAVLVERDGRELPVCADVCGQRFSPRDGEHIKLYGPEPLEVHVR